MDKFYTEKKLPIVSPGVAAEAKHVEIEQIKKLPPGYTRPEQININTKRPSPLETRFNRIVKRSFDVLLAALFIVFILSWLIPLLAIFIKLDSKGPVFFLQKRSGLGGKTFTCIKFRSMFMNEEADLLAEQENDARITRLGKFLRKWHIDELPQLFNVLMGDMSLVGRRPYMIQENNIFENLFSGYAYRYKVKPGITGYAQSRGNYGNTRDLKKLKQRVDLDFLYIQKWSPAMDVKILFHTCRMIAGKSQD
ncbi:MAG: sugar transferase [Ferruginibacter sp.]